MSKAPSKGIIIGGICAVVAVAVVAIGFGTGLFGKSNDKANVLADNIPITSGKLDAGATFTVAGEQGDYWQTTIDGKTAYISKANSITDSQKAAAAAYAAAAANRQSTAQPQQSAPAQETPAPTPAEPSGGEDGGEISLTSGVVKILDIFKPDVAYAAEAGENATVLEGGADIVVGFVNRGDEVEIVEVLDDGTTKVKINGVEGFIKSNLIRKESEAAPAEKDAFAVVGAVIYSDVDLANKVRNLNANDVVHIVDQIGDVLVVTVDGTTYYMAAAQTSETQVEVPVVTYTPKASTSESTDSGAQSSSEQSAPAAPVQEWTEELL